MNEMDLAKCRLCLEDASDNQMFDLFPESKKDELKLYEKVEYCCNVKIRQSPEMPSAICIKCFDITRMWFNFRQMCVNSQVYLESLCNDRKRPKELSEDDEGAYLNYLLQELQTTDSNSTRVKIEDSLAEHFIYADDFDEEHYYEEAYVEDLDGQEEFVEMFDSMNSGNEIESEIDALETTEQEIKVRKQPKSNVQRKKSNATKEGDTKKKIKILKRALRPASPNSYMCSVCGNVYTRKASFTYHMALHSNVKPHECEICGKAFRQVSELRNHMRRHTGEKPYKCSYCDRHFIDRSEKHRHERVHTNTRPYVCKVCGKSFTYSTILKNHSKLHSGEKDFNCLVCEKSFSLQHQLKAHLQTLTHKQKETQFVAAGYEVVYE